MIKGILNKGRLSLHFAIPCHTLWTVVEFTPTARQWTKAQLKLCKNYLEKKQSAGILSVTDWCAQSSGLTPNRAVKGAASPYGS